MKVLRISPTGQIKDNIEVTNMTECLVTIKHIKKLEALRDEYTNNKCTDFRSALINEAHIKAIRECIAILEGK